MTANYSAVEIQKIWLVSSNLPASLHPAQMFLTTILISDSEIILFENSFEKRKDDFNELIAFVQFPRVYSYDSL